MAKVRIPKGIPSTKKILKRGLYELMWGAKPRNHGKRVNGR